MTATPADASALQLGEFLVREVDVRQPLRPAVPVMDAAEVDRRRMRDVGQQPGHRLDLAGEDEDRHRARLPLGQPPPRLLHVHELDLELRGHRHPVEVLLPPAGGHVVVHQHDVADPEGAGPPQHHLSVDEPVVDAAESDGHQGVRMARSPVATARAAASAGASSG